MKVSVEWRRLVEHISIACGVVLGTAAFVAIMYGLGYLIKAGFLEIFGTAAGQGAGFFGGVGMLFIFFLYVWLSNYVTLERGEHSHEN